MDIRQSISNQTDHSFVLAHRVISAHAPHSNHVVSPLSIHVLLGMLAAGSKGPTGEEILRFLMSTSSDALNSFFSQIVAAVLVDGGPLGGPVLSSANGVWVDLSLNLKPAYSNLARNCYRAVSERVDFQRKMSFVYVNLRYGGDWVDCVYNGGQQRTLAIERYALTVSNLKYKIRDVISSCELDFDVFYLKISRRGRSIKYLLTENEDFAKLFRKEREPTVYVCGNSEVSSSHGGASSSHGGAREAPVHSYVPTYEPQVPYVPSYDFYGMSASNSYNSSRNWDAEVEVDALQRTTASSTWFEDSFLGSFNRESTERGSTIPDLNQETGSHVEHGEQPLYEDDEDANDKEYEEESEEESVVDEDEDDEEEEVELESDDEPRAKSRRRNMNRALFAEYTTWIQEECGMQKLLQLFYPDPNENEANNAVDEGPMVNWIVPMVPIRPNISAVCIEENPNVEGLVEGAMYDTKEEVHIAAGLWNLELGAECVTRRSEPDRLYLNCKHSKECPFLLRAQGDETSWHVHRFNGRHTCKNELENVHTINVHSNVIGAFFAKRIQRDCKIMTPRMIMNELRAEFGVHVKYDLALRGRNKAIEVIYGKFEDSFKLLPSYLHMLKQTNEGTITDLELDHNGRFKYVFVALGATRVAYPLCMRPVIVVDGTHLKGKNCGILYAAVTKDANE